MQSQRSITVERLIDDLGDKLGDYAKWQGSSQVTIDDANAMIKQLRKTFKDDSYPRGFLWLAMCHIANAIYVHTINRDVKVEGLRAAWMKIGELLGDQP